MRLKNEVKDVSTGEKIGRVINVVLTPEQRARMRKLITKMKQKDIPIQGIRQKIGSRGINLALIYYDKLLDNIPEEVNENA